MQIIQNQTFDQERAFYGAKDTIAENCRFDGPADGQSAARLLEKIGLH